MKTRMLMGAMLVGIAVVVCLAGRSAVFGQTESSSQSDVQAEEQKPAKDAYDSEIEELRLRREAAVKDVNEAEKAELARVEAVKTNRYLEELGYVPSDKVLSNEDVTTAEKQRAEKEKAVRARFDSEVKRLEERKSRALEARSAGTEGRGETGPRLAKPTPPKGNVTGIVYTDRGGAALVDGEIIHENDTIHDVKVVKILPDTVEFEKNGNRWKQRVRQTPALFWQPPEPESVTPAVSELPPASANE